MILTSFWLKSQDKCLPEADYPYWPSYNYLELDDVNKIEAQVWKPVNHTIKGWDWSLPVDVEPSPKGLIALQRNIGTHKKYMPYTMSFPNNAVGILWVKWRDIEPTEGNYNFDPIIDRIKSANKKGVNVVLRVLCHSLERGIGPKAKEKDEWHIKKQVVPPVTGATQQVVALV